MYSKTKTATGDLASTLRQTAFGLLAVAAALLWIASPAHSLVQNGKKYSVSSGTGFIVSNHGYIVTNAHVVKGCNSVTIRGGVKETKASVVARNADIDLALIKADIYPSRVAALRDYGGPIQPGDKAMVIGYPLESGVTGEYKVATTSIMDVRGPTGEPKWLQFQDSAQQGNSGGPLLDMSGNVIGVIVGKSTLMRYEPTSARNEVIANSDLAISLPYLRKFLNQNRVYYRKMTSQTYLAGSYIERQAAEYIVNIHCIMPVDSDQYQGLSSNQ